MTANAKVRNVAMRSFLHRFVMNPTLYCWWSIEYLYQLFRQKYKAVTSADSPQIQLKPATPQDRLFLRNKKFQYQMGTMSQSESEWFGFNETKAWQSETKE